MGLTTTEEAARIRAEYKKRGWSSRDISVRAEYFSMESSINVEIKNPAVDFKTAERIANGAERIDRCEYSGEILSGGNRFVHVRHSREACEVIARRHVAALEAAVAAIGTEESSTLIPIEGTRALIGCSGYNTYTLWMTGDHGRREAQVWIERDGRGVSDAAYRLAMIEGVTA